MTRYSYSNLKNYDTIYSIISNWNSKVASKESFRQQRQGRRTGSTGPGCVENSKMKCCNCKDVVQIVMDILFSPIVTEDKALQALAEKALTKAEVDIESDIQQPLESIGLSFLSKAGEKLIAGINDHIYGDLFKQITTDINASSDKSKVKITFPSEAPGGCKITGYWEFAACATGNKTLIQNEAANNKQVAAAYLGCFMKGPICDVGVMIDGVTKQNFCVENKCIIWSEIIALFFSNILMNILADIKPEIFNMCPSDPPLTEEEQPKKASLWGKLLSNLTNAINTAAQEVICEDIFKCDRCGCFAANCKKHSDCCQDASGGMACNETGICAWPASNATPGDVSQTVPAGSRCQTISGWTNDGNQQCVSGSCSDPQGGGTCNKSIIGGKCGNNNDCANNKCSTQIDSVDNTYGTCVECNENHECGQGKYCDLSINKCVQGKGTGAACVPAADSGSQCLSGCCAGGRCVECQAGANWPGCPKLPDPPSGKFCDPTGILQNKAGNNVACTSNQVCSSGHCYGLKVGGDAAGVCKPAGYCVLPTDCGGSTPYCSKNKCVSKVPIGTVCISDNVCSSGFCLAGVCGNQPDCTEWGGWGSCSGRNCPEGGQLRGKQSRSSTKGLFDHPNCRPQTETQSCGTKDSCMRKCASGWGCARTAQDHGVGTQCYDPHYGKLKCTRCFHDDYHGNGYVWQNAKSGNVCAQWSDLHLFNNCDDGPPGGVGVNGKCGSWNDGGGLCIEGNYTNKGSMYGNYWCKPS